MRRLMVASALWLALGACDFYSPTLRNDLKCKISCPGDDICRTAWPDSICVPRNCTAYPNQVAGSTRLCPKGAACVDLDPDSIGTGWSCQATSVCDPFATGNCPDGETCMVELDAAEDVSRSSVDAVFCTSAGTLAVDAFCTSSSECRPGTMCGGGGRCHKLCDPRSPVCPSGNSCHALSQLPNLGECY